MIALYFYVIFSILFSIFSFNINKSQRMRNIDINSRKFVLLYSLISVNKCYLVISIKNLAINSMIWYFFSIHEWILIFAINQRIKNAFFVDIWRKNKETNYDKTKFCTSKGRENFWFPFVWNRVERNFNMHCSRGKKKGIYLPLEETVFTIKQLNRMPSRGCSQFKLENWFWLVAEETNPLFSRVRPRTC